MRCGSRDEASMTHPSRKRRFPIVSVSFLSHVWNRVLEGDSVLKFLSVGMEYEYVKLCLR